MSNADKNNNTLAIVIPAYKSSFLRETLESISIQSDKRFHLYIGNDNGDKEIDSIISEFQNKIPISYHYFNKNLGKVDLVAHWERCIDLVQNENWIWLFSDDDIMDKECVKEFYEHSSKSPKADIFHFNVSEINEAGQLPEKQTYRDFPENYDISAFAKDRLNNKVQSFVVEYVFKKSKYLEVGKFQNFDLAWGSDVATCIKLGHPVGIYTIPNARVFWRKSSQNISPDKTRKMVERKLASLMEYLNWIATYSSDHNLKFEISPVGIYLRRLIAFRFNQPLRLTAAQILTLLKKNIHI